MGEEKEYKHFRGRISAQRLQAYTFTTHAQPLLVGLSRKSINDQLRNFAEDTDRVVIRAHPSGYTRTPPKLVRINMLTLDFD